MNNLANPITDFLKWDGRVVHMMVIRSKPLTRNPSLEIERRETGRLDLVKRTGKAAKKYGVVAGVICCGIELRMEPVDERGTLEWYDDLFVLFFENTEQCNWWIEEEERRLRMVYKTLHRELTNSVANILDACT